jgi:hypothetical protein
MYRIIIIMFACLFAVSAWGADRCSDPAERMAGARQCQYRPLPPVKEGRTMFDPTPMQYWRLP